MHDYIVCYAKNSDVWQRNLLPRTDKQNRAYSNPDNDPRGPWKASDLSARNYYSAGKYSIRCPNGRIISGPPQGMYWRVSEAKLQEMDKDSRIWWGKDGNNVPAIKRFLSEVLDGIVPQTMWFYEEVGHNQAAKQHLKQLLPDIEELFVTPKPEGLIQRILQIASKPGDLILDSFSGTGTTGTAAHKMGRRWIMVELGEHCHTHIIPRLKKVIDGQDPGGITSAANWTGGGGFRYFRLAPSLLQQDPWGNWVISKQFNGPMLAEAVCKLCGFTYAPSDTLYWQHGHSTECDFIYVTTQTLTREQLAQLSEEVGDKRSLLVCCGAFRTKADAFHNLTLKKIPKAVLSRCEWGKDDYSLKIAELPVVEAEPLEVAPKKAEAQTAKPKAKTKNERRAEAQLTLFGGGK